MSHDLHMTWNPLRITNVWVKVAYFAAWIVFNLVVFSVALGWTEPWVRQLVGLPLDVAWFVIAVRSFRVTGEPLTPRPWWKATGRAKASLVLAILAALLGVVGVVQLVTQSEAAFANALSLVFWVPVAVYFFNSGVRLRRDPPPPREGRLGDPLPKSGFVKFP